MVASCLSAKAWVDVSIETSLGQPLGSIGIRAVVAMRVRPRGFPPLTKTIGMRRGNQEDMPAVRSWPRRCSTASMRQQECSVRRKASTAQQASPMQPFPNVLEIALGCKSFHSVPCTLSGSERMDRLCKGQRDDGAGKMLQICGEVGQSVNHGVRSLTPTGFLWANMRSKSTNWLVAPV